MSCEVNGELEPTVGSAALEEIRSETPRIQEKSPSLLVHVANDEEREMLQCCS